MNVEEQIRNLVPNDKYYTIGFADLTNLLADKYKSYNYGIVIGKKLDDKIVDSVISGPNFEYYKQYNQTNKDLSELVHKISEKLKSLNISSFVIEPTIADKELDGQYIKTLRYDFSHKMVATRAGIGWIGKTALLISDKFGPRLRLATILTNYSLPCSNKPINESKCGLCNLCVEQCPARAANGELWDINIDRDSFFNPFKCREKCLELSWKNMKIRTSICGICVSICPIGRKNKK